MLNTEEQRQKKIRQCIAEKKQEMISIADQKGYAHNETIQCSQELDALILQYQRELSKF